MHLLPKYDIMFIMNIHTNITLDFENHAFNIFCITESLSGVISGNEEDTKQQTPFSIIQSY